MRCFQCDSDNPEQGFCGTCGAPLKLDVFVARQVRAEFEQHTQQRDLVERESAIRIVETAYGWAKKLGVLALLIVAPFAAVGVYKWSDLLSAISSAKQNVSKTASDERKAIEAASATAQLNIAQVSSSATRESRAAVQEAKAAKSQVTQQTAEAQTEIARLHEQIEAANGLRPEMVAIREELTKQQRALSSSEEFAKNIFTSHRVEFFQQEQMETDHYKILPRKNGNGATVYLLLGKVPIAQTLQLQYHVFSQPNNSYVNIHNLVIFSWGDPADSLKTHQLSASYFPDGSDKDVIKVLSERDGRVYADGEPLFRLGESDPAFTGNKWVAFQK
jgi:hypothetical protein